MDKTLIIAEAGVNHNGSLDMAIRMVNAAVEAGIDAVKFQTFKAEKMITFDAPKATYQKETTGANESQLEMVKKLELDETAHIRLHQHCQHKGVQFLSSPFDLESIDLLVRLGIKIFKIPSGEITNLPYLRKLGELGKELIMSTGMADLGEIEAALVVLMQSGTAPEDITVLHCNTEYPTPFQDVNLNAMLTIKAAFPGIQVGYSDHTPGIEVPIAAVALGARVIEKHFTLDRNMEGPDHIASIEPKEMNILVKTIRDVEAAMGDGIKRPMPSELPNKTRMQKSLVATRSIAPGEIIGKSDLTCKRPGSGLPPKWFEKVLGKRAAKQIEKDGMFDLDSIIWSD